MSHSQHDEQRVALEILGNGRTRRFLDIGAHDGLTFSNSRRLIELGWSGTLVEPSPVAFSLLMRNCEKYSGLSLVHAAAVPNGAQRLIKFYDSRGDMVSTMDESHRKLWEGRGGHAIVGAQIDRNVRFQPIFVAALSIADLLAQFPGPYDFVTLDVEGINLDLFRELPLRALGAIAVCVEYQDKRKEMEAIAASQGYVIAHTTHENLIFKSK